MGVRDRLKHAYNAFLNQERPNATMVDPGTFTDYGAGYSRRPDVTRFGISNDRTILASIYARIAIDAASIDIRHVMLDEQDRYIRDVKSGLHNCLNVEANLDQSGRDFMQDVYMTLLEGGHIAMLPVEMGTVPRNGGLFEVGTMRVGIVVQWYHQHVRVEAYNELTGRREQVTVNKRHLGLVENPFITVMNEPNSTLKRLTRKLALLDMTDEKTSSGKLDMLIQLPYPIRHEGKRMDAELRRSELEQQLQGSQHGIGYIDAQEKVVQLNRPVENNLLKQVEYLLELLYTQLGLTPAVMNGTASEAEMLNYFNRTIEPLIGAVSAELNRKFLTKTARTQGHNIMYFRDPFKLVPMAQLAELADKFTRNEIVSSNEFRGFIGMRPVLDDPKADMLINSNLTVEQSQLQRQAVGAELEDPNVIDAEVVSDTDDEEDPFAEVNKVLDDTFKLLGVEE